LLSPDSSPLKKNNIAFGQKNARAWKKRRFLFNATFFTSDSIKTEHFYGAKFYKNSNFIVIERVVQYILFIIILTVRQLLKINQKFKEQIKKKLKTLVLMFFFASSGRLQIKKKIKVLEGIVKCLVLHCPLSVCLCIQ